MIGPRHPQSTRPMKRGCPLTSGTCATRSALEVEIAKRRALGWNINRIAVRFELSWRTARDLIQKLESNT